MTDKKRIRESILDEAKGYICNNREAEYGTPEDNFGLIGRLWSVYLGVEVTAEDVGLMMALFKIARIKVGTAKRDSFADAIGYVACAAEIALGVEK